MHKGCIRKYYPVVIEVQTKRSKVQKFLESNFLNGIWTNLVYFMYKKHFWLLEFKGLQCRDMFLMTQAIQREQTSQTFSIKS